MRSSRFIVLLMLAALSLLAAGKHPITVLDAARGNPPDSPPPIWRPDGRAFLYEEGGRVYLYDLADRKAKEWFQLHDVNAHQAPAANSPQHPFQWQNRRVDTSKLQWFPDGKAVLVPQQDNLSIVDAGQSRARESLPGLNESNVPTLSPDGRSILFRRDSNLFVFDLSSKKTVPLTVDGTVTLLNGQLDWVYPEELDLGTAFWWSPDSKQIAFFQFDVSREQVFPHADLLGLRAIYEPQRYPQAGTPNAQVKVGVVSAAGGKVTWLKTGDTATTLLARACWIDSHTLAIQRLTRVQDRLQLLFADTQSGDVRTILEERSDTWINLADDFRFLPSKNQFVWSSERDGYRHLYLFSAAGQLIRRLTSGPWQVNGVTAIDAAAGFVYYTGTQISPLEEHLYRVSLNGDAPQQLTRDFGTHHIQMDAGGHAYLDTFSNSSTPPVTSIYEADSNEVAVFRKPYQSVVEHFDVLPSEILTVKASDGTLLYARLIRPAHFNPNTKYPAIVFVYGGPGAQSIHNQWTGISWEQALAHRGYVIWQLDNRGSTGRGHAFEAPIYHQFGRTELADQRVGVQKLLSLGFVDSKRLGIYGWSYGGYMTIYSLLHAPGLFRAGIAGAPVTDWHNYDSIYTERYLGLPEENAAGYQKSSNVLAARNLKAKLLIVCNYEDDNVLFQNTMQMMNALHEAGKQFELMLYPQKTHHVSGDFREGMLEAMTGFFDRTLRGGEEKDGSFRDNNVDLTSNIR